MQVAVVGSGHVGLVTGAGLAELGHHVTCADINEEKVDLLQQGICPIFEPGLPELLKANLDKGRLVFTADVAEAVRAGQVIFITVDTPSREDGSADLSQVERVTRSIAQAANGFKLVVEKSTVPVNTCEWVRRTLRMFTAPDGDFDVASMPEFLREGSAVYDFFHPSRMVIGVETPRAEQMLKELFKGVDAPFLVTDIQSAELIKHASNCFLAMKISYINAIANICERVGADVTQVAKGMGMDHRIGKEFLEAGVGYGGACFPKDLAAFIKIAEDLGVDFGLLKEVHDINTQQRALIVRKLRKLLWTLKGKTVGVLGLAFKPNTEDMRQAPSVDIIRMLLQEKALIRAYDPAAMEGARLVFNADITYCEDPYALARGCDALVLLTQWDEFLALDMKRIKDLMVTPVLVDGRNLYDPAQMKAMGFLYDSIGR